MKPRPPIIQADGEIRSLSAADMKLFKPAKEVLEPEMYGVLLAMNRALKDVPRLDKSRPLVARDAQVLEIDSIAISAGYKCGVYTQDKDLLD